jgi:hypothetical protein
MDKEENRNKTERECGEDYKEKQQPEGEIRRGRQEKDEGEKQ